MPDIDTALVAIRQARILVPDEAKAQVDPTLEVATKALTDEQITDEDLGRLHGAAETAVREALGRPRG